MPSLCASPREAAAARERCSSAAKLESGLAMSDALELGRATIFVIGGTSIAGLLEAGWREAISCQGQYVQ